MSFWDDLSDLSSKIGEQLGGRERYQPVVAVAGSLLVGSSLLAAYKATEDSNALQRQREAITAAGTEIAQQPNVTGSQIGATGEVQISRGISGWLPIALAFIVVMYVIFKD